MEAAGNARSEMAFVRTAKAEEKSLVLIVESRDESWKRMVQGLYAREKIRDLSGL